MRHTPTFQDLAIPEFKRKFGDLLSVRATFDDYDHGMIVGVMSDLFLLHLEAGDSEHWEKTVRAAHYYLDQGALKKPRDVCESFMRIADEIAPALNRVMEKQKAARNTAVGDVGIEAYLSLYKTLVEGLMTLIAGPVVVGFAAHYGSKAMEFAPKPDGRVNLRAIESMENWVLHPSHRLKEGLNSHVRNAYSHERYRIRSYE